jgi:hypothetical protein
MTFDGGYTCSVHHVPMLVTQSGLQHVCSRLDCDEHVRAQGPRKEDPVTKKENNDKDRKALIADAAAKAKAKDKPADPPPPAAKPKKEPKKAKDESMLSVSDIAREMKLEPKNVRAKLRSAADVGPFGFDRAPDGRWPLVERDSKEHKAIVALLTPAELEEPDDDSDDDEEDEDDEE